MISESPTPFLAEHMLDIYSSSFCNGGNSPLHIVVQNERKRQWTFPSYSFLGRLFVKFSSIYLDNCYDKDGYNLLHKSVIGGHPKAVKYLLENGMNVLQNTKTNQSALTLSILLAPYTRNGSIPSYYYTNHSKFHSYKLVNQTETADILFDHNGTISFDDIASILLMHLEKLQFNRTKLKLAICPYPFDDFGLMHIASAKGMVSFMKSSKELFGDDILRCRDMYGVTPIYLAYIYRQTNIVQWLEKMNCTFHRPNRASETILIYNLIENYELSLPYKWRCFTNFGQGFKELRRNQILKCTGQDLRLHSTFQNPIKRVVYKILQDKMSASFGENYWQWLKFENYHLFLLNYHWKKKSHNQVYYLYRLLLLFGFDDRRYLFQLLYSRRTSEKGTRFDPISDFTVKTLFDSTLSKKYEHFRKLKMETDLHTSWLSNEKHAELREDFQYVLYSNYEVEHFSTILQQWDEVSDAGIILKDKANRNCNVCQYSLSMCFVNTIIQKLSYIKTYEQLNREAMKFIPECNYVCSLSLRMLYHSMNNTFKFIADLKTPHKNEFKSLVIELELRIKRTVKMIDSFSETENANIQPFELFYCSPVFHGFMSNINDLEMYNMIKCTKLYANNEHLKNFRKFLITMLQAVEREFEYDYHI
ncbi:unnamed protein product [Mytilus coruscus]|uniref:Uncharacterized protein n=1 Tax=Mytilus coruscus TaxID=42192 RepID=A0A6J8CDR2_MYTCO|nr:unnamed protein product [Mytilus coruscus]